MDVLLSICCVTYNHSKFIRKAIDGFVNQKTDFVFEILIHDDASTDNTQEIIVEYQKKYPELIKPILRKENIKSKMGGGVNVEFNMKRAKGKYIALCDGDDYWTDPFKLQKQVDILKGNEDISLVYSNVKIESDHEGDYINDPVFFDSSYPTEAFKSQAFFLKSNFALLTVSVMFRKENLDIQGMNLVKKFATGDLVQYIMLSGKGDFYYINETLAVYNDHGKGVSKTLGKVKRNLHNYKNIDLLLPYIQPKNIADFNYFCQRFLIQPVYSAMISMLNNGKGKEISFAQIFFVKLKHLKPKYLYYMLKLISLKIIKK